MPLVEFILSHLCDRLSLYQLLATLTTYSVINIILFFQKRHKRYKLFEYYGIPGPRPRLLDGNLHTYLSDEAGYKVDQAFNERYGKFYGIFIGDEPSIVISDLEILREVFFARASSFKLRSIVFIDTPISQSVLFARYHRWKAMRKIMASAFSAYSMRGNSSTEFVEESIRLMLDYVQHKFKLDSRDANEDNGAGNKKAAAGSIEIDVQELMKATALHMISSMAVKLPDVSVREEENNVKSLDAYLSSCDKGVVLHAIRLPFLKRILSFIATHIELNATMRVIHQGLDWKIDKSLKSLSEAEAGGLKQEQAQLIDKLIKLHHEGKLTRREVIGNAEAILVAGYDTTSTTLSYIFWVLGKHLDVQEKLRHELMAHGVESKYLEQVINETMRLYPTVISFVTRLATETVTIGQLTVPQGTRVQYNAWLIYRNQNVWPEPDKFDPERFREGADIDPCAFAPFGLGDRKCLGYQLAMLEMKMILCEILMRYRVRTKTPQELQLITCAVVLTKPKEKIIIELEEL